MNLSKKVAVGLMLEIDKAVENWREDYLECLKNDLKTFQNKGVDEEVDKETEKILSVWFYDFLGSSMIRVVEAVNQTANASEEMIERLYEQNKVKH